MMNIEGFADSTEAFLENRLEKSTAFELYKNGYDVSISIKYSIFCYFEYIQLFRQS